MGCIATYTLQDKLHGKKKMGLTVSVYLCQYQSYYYAHTSNLGIVAPLQQ